MKNCPNCGSEVIQEARFCHNCREDMAEGTDYAEGGIIFVLSISVGILIGVGFSNFSDIIMISATLASSFAALALLNTRSSKTDILRDGFFLIAISIPVYILMFYSTSESPLTEETLIAAIAPALIFAGFGYALGRFTDLT